MNASLYGLDKTMCTFSANFTFDKAMNGHTDILYYYIIIIIMIILYFLYSLSPYITQTLHFFHLSLSCFSLPVMECVLSSESEFLLVLGIHFVVTWYDPLLLTGHKTSSIYLYLSQVEKIIAEEWTSFRAGQSTSEQIFNLWILCEEHLEHQQGLYHVFIDFKKVFDRV